MVVLNRIYTRTGDDGRTRLASGEPVSKAGLRVEAYGEVDEANAALGAARLHVGGDAQMEAVLARVQNEMFDLGADLATPRGEAEGRDTRLRVTPAQVSRLEADLDAMNEDLRDLTSFVLPTGTALACALHLARTTTRRAERAAVRLAEAEGESVNAEALKYLNRLSDLLFVASRRANTPQWGGGSGDVLWKPGETR